MPDSYTRPLIPPTVVLPNLRRQPWGVVLDYDYNVTTTNKITINRIAGAAIDFTPNNPTSVLAQLDKIPTLVANPVFILDDALAFTSISPDTYTVGAPAQAYEIVGTGFAASGINTVKFDTGTPGDAQVLALGSGFNITDSTHINTGAFSLDNPGTYTVYYSIDSGANYITMGLTVTVDV